MPKLPVGHPTKDGDVASSVSALTKRSYRHTTKSRGHDHECRHVETSCYG